MDEIDFMISMLLMLNSRQSYSELAEMFKMSVNSIHKRVKSMVDLGIIQKFKTQINHFNFPNIVNLLAFGVSKTKNPKTTMEKMGIHEGIHNVTQASNNLFFIHAFIRNINQLDSLVTFIRDKGEINDLTVGIQKSPNPIMDKNPTELSLSEKDYLIINSLKENSRKTISDIADELNISTKTIRRHLDTMIESGLVLFTIDWYPDKTSEFLTFITLKVQSGSKIDEIKLQEDFNKLFGKKLLFSWSFSNLPDLLIICIWIGVMKELQRIENFLRQQEFESVDVAVLVEGKNFPTWIDSFLESKIKEIKQKQQ